MKVWTPLISWHNRERVSAVDYQPVPFPKPTKTGGNRIASGGDDHHVVIWELVTDETGKVEPQCVCDVNRHQNLVHAVKWSPDGQTLASADIDSAIFLWRFNDSEAVPDIFGEENSGDGSANRENWTVWKTLRGHLQDILSVAWSPCGKFLASCSTDCTAIIFDVNKGSKLKMLDDHKGWVNGVAWDPLNEFVVSISSDRTLRAFKTKNYKVAAKTYRAQLPVPVTDKEDPGNVGKVDVRNVRLFHDDTFTSFFRRPDFSPDGELLVVPSGVLEIEGEAAIRHCTHVFSRTNLAKPVMYLPAKDYSTAVRFSPVKYELNPVRKRSPVPDGEDPEKPWNKYETLFCLPYRMIFAVATKSSVLIYDTQQAEPIGRVSQIHYICLNDLAWSNDGNTLIVCSTDGYCTIVSFKPGQLGKVYAGETAETSEDLSVETNKIVVEADKMSVDDHDNDFGGDNDSVDVPLSKEGIPLNKEGVCSPAEIKIRSLKEGGRPNPRRLQLITISSPKSGSKNDDLDENDLNLVLEDTNHDTEPVKSVDQEKPAEKKKRVPFVTLASGKNS